jgi:hypothetical protein
MLGREVLRHLATHFVARQPEIDMLEERVATVRAGGIVFEAVLMFYGVGWIGKTTLLNELYRRTAGRGIPSTLIDFDKQRINDTYDQPITGRVRLLERMAADIASGVELHATVLNHQVDAFWNLWKRAPDDKALVNDQVKAIKDAFLEYTSNLLGYMGKMPIVFFFDTIEQSPELLDWLEGEIIAPLLKTDKVLFVVSGRYPKRWKLFTVRRRVREHELGPFSPEMTQEQLGVRMEEKAIAHNLGKITFNHPGFNRAVVQQLVDQGQDIRPEVLEEGKEALVESLVEEVFERVVIRKIDPDIRHALLWVAPLRQFDIGALSEVLGAFLPDQYGSKPPSFFLNLTGRMVDTTLVEWSKARKGYVISNPVRKVLTLRMQLHAPEDYRAVNQAAIDWYERLIGEGHFVLIVEKLYHLARLEQARQTAPEQIGEQTRAELEKCLGHLREEKEATIDVVSETDLIHKELEGDHEFKEVLGANYYHWLTDVITEFQRGLERSGHSAACGANHI